MIDPTSRIFEESVELNYQLYNSLFLTLPLDAVQQTGHLLPLLAEACQQGLAEELDPEQIIHRFFDVHKPDLDEQQRVQFLFRIIQYVERQVVLIDALEDAAYSRIHGLGDKSALARLVERTEEEEKADALERLLSSFGVRVVLTAHPTQFYPGPVLAIISDLTQAISHGSSSHIRDLLQQLGNTPYFQKEKPTPYDEAVLLTWYLGNVFYEAVGDLLDPLAQRFPEIVEDNPELISIGFWPGGDRDGNPYVTTDTTMQVAEKLRYTILNCYHQNLRTLKRRLSFSGIYEQIDEMEKALHRELTSDGRNSEVSQQQMLRMLDDIEQRLVRDYQSLYLDLLLSFRRKLLLFGFHFASLDIRQDSRVIARTLDAVREAYPDILPADFDQRSEQEQIDCLMHCRGEIDPGRFEDPVIRDTIASCGVLRRIQQRNGERGAHRYIISNCRGAIDVARVQALLRLGGWQDAELTVDIVPLFETIDDLQRASDSMQVLYAHSTYRSHLQRRNDRQTVMLGFSDGTKDGGYLMANWAIYRAKEDITRTSRDVGIEVIFFDGRGGPPARGGGDMYLFYAALGRRIESGQIQTTVQGQTISSYYGHRVAAVHNLGQLLTAGLENNLYDREDRELDPLQRNLMEELARCSYEKYQAFKEHPLFLPYLEEMSTLKYYGAANIGSRPSKRGGDESINFEDLRAIPFVGAWSQLKQNVPGFYGLGTALKEQERYGRLDACLALYQNSRFFRALIANSMQSMSKTNFELTRYMAKDERFGEFWQMIYDEYELSREMVLKVSGQKQLLEDNPRSRQSIALRERVVLPLLTIQQYALIRIQECRRNGDDEAMSLYEKMVIRSLFGNINAARNSA